MNEEQTKEDIIGEIFFELQKEKNNLLKPLRREEIGEVGTTAMRNALTKTEVNNSLKITEVDNGFILSWIEDWSDEKGQDFRVAKRVVEDVNDMDDSFKKLLFAVAEHFGRNFDKFRGDNLNISFDGRGSKFTD